MPKIRRHFWSSASVFAVATTALLVPLAVRSETQCRPCLLSHHSSAIPRKQRRNVDGCFLQAMAMAWAGAS